MIVRIQIDDVWEHEVYGGSETSVVGNPLRR